jgi:arsenate reductase (thioredoxin)
MQKLEAVSKPPASRCAAAGEGWQGATTTNVASKGGGEGATTPAFAGRKQRPREVLKRLLDILFLCTANSCRSQMAEAWARQLKSDSIDSYSAGVQPRPVNPLAIQVMKEVGIDLTHHRSKHLSDLKNIPFDFVVTVCDQAHESCPLFPQLSHSQTKIVHKGFDDPPRLAKSAKTESEALAHYRRVRDEIRAFIQTLPGALTHESTTP